MLDVKRIREDPETVKALLAIKGGEYPIDRIASLDRDRRRVLVAMEDRKALRNRVSQEIAALKRRGEDAEGRIGEMRQVGEEIAALEAELNAIDAELNDLLLSTPNPPLPDVPLGSDSEANFPVYHFGNPPDFAFEPLPHWEIGERLGILDFERARKITGARFTVFRGNGPRLLRALITFMLDHARSRGYEEVAPPYLVNETSMTGTGQFPKFVDDVFEVKRQGLYLIPTAEVPLVNLHRDEIFTEADLPVKYVAYTACFRSEAGAAGRDTRGLIRQHQFDKVELVQFVVPSDSPTALEAMRRDAETVLEALDLPFRTVLLCGGDMGFGQAKTYDLEVWMPSYQRYVEISSVSTMTDFQARRAEIRYRPEGSKKTDLVHTLNGSALAVGRTIAAILENCQTADGHVEVPAVLVPYLGFTQL